VGPSAGVPKDSGSRGAGRGQTSVQGFDRPKVQLGTSVRGSISTVLAAFCAVANPERGTRERANSAQRPKARLSSRMWARSYGGGRNQNFANQTVTLSTL
jgi:hypothetical protein